MATSTNFTDVAAFRAYVEKFGDQLISRGFYGNRTAEIVTPHEGVKGKKILTLLTLGTLGRRYSKTFAPPAGTVKFTPRELDVEAGKFELSFVPQEFESSYLGMYRKKTFNDSDEIPFEGYIMNDVMKKQAQEIENSMWRAVKAVSPADTDTLMMIHDGYLTKLAKDQALGSPKLTAYATPGGAVTQNNIIEVVEGMWDRLDPEYQDMPIGIFLKPQLWSWYQRKYRDDYSKYNESMQTGRLKLDFCDGELIRTPGMGTSNRIVMSPIENLHYGYDGIDDATTFNFEKDHRAVDYWADFKMGVQFGIMEDGVMVINDLD